MIDLFWRRRGEKKNSKKLKTFLWVFFVSPAFFFSSLSLVVLKKTVQTHAPTRRRNNAFYSSSLLLAILRRRAKTQPEERGEKLSSSLFWRRRGEKKNSKKKNFFVSLFRLSPAFFLFFFSLSLQKKHTQRSNTKLLFARNTKRTKHFTFAKTQPERERVSERRETLWRRRTRFLFLRGSFSHVLRV